MSETPSDRRRDDRLAVGWPGTVTTAHERSYPCRVADVSLAGTKIESEADVAVGDELLLSLPELGDFAGKVQWVGDAVFGLALQAGPDLLLKRVAEEPENYPQLSTGAKSSNDNG